MERLLAVATSCVPSAVPASGRGGTGGDPVSTWSRLHGVDIWSPLAGLGPVVGTDPGSCTRRGDGNVDPTSSPRGWGRRLRVQVDASAPLSNAPPPGRLVLDTVVGGHRLHWAAQGRAGWTLRVPAVCDIVVADTLDEVVCRPAPRTSEEQLVLLVRGLVLAFVLTMAGECVLHASAVEVRRPAGADGERAEAVAFAGPSGTGKSTLAASACMAGAPFIADDLLRVRPGAPSQWFGRSAALRLRPGAYGVVDGRSEQWAAEPTADGRLALHPEQSSHEWGTLRSVVLPRPSPDGQLRARRASAAEAVMALLRAGRLVQWLDRAVLERQFTQAVELADHLPVVVVDVPWVAEPPELPGADDALEDSEVWPMRRAPAGAEETVSGQGPRRAGSRYPEPTVGAAVLAAVLRECGGS